MALKQFSYIVMFAATVLFACKKDVEIYDAKNNFAGNYECIKVTHSMSFDTANHMIQLIDTTGPVFIGVSRLEGNAYHLNIGSNALDISAPKGVNFYNPSCSIGPCPSVRFYAGDSIYLFMRISNPVSVYYYGKKQVP